MTETALRKTPLHVKHLKRNARMAPFAGWDIPVQFASIAAEHEAVRTDVGVFDVSHMGHVLVSGGDAAELLEELLPAEPGKLKTGEMLYSVLCTEEGGIVDDLIVYRVRLDVFLLVVNASRTEVDLKWVEKAAVEFADVEVYLATDNPAILAIQGPQAEGLLAPLLGEEIRLLPYYSFIEKSGTFGDILVSRNGYTGEDGFEVICAAERAELLWEAVIGAGAVPCGLGCRDTLRTEMGYCLYGNEINETTNPIQARLGWTLCLEKKAEFIGKKALNRLRDHGEEPRLVGVTLLGQGIPRKGQAVLSQENEEVGHVTSGTYSTTLKKGIALCYVERRVLTKRKTKLQIDIRGKRKHAEVVGLPFVPSHVRKGKND